MSSNIKNFLHRLRAIAAVVYFRFPARDMKIIGVTGTDGKTTTATLIYHLLQCSGRNSALISTVAAYIGKKEIETGLHVTTPNPWDLQRLIKRAVDAGCEYLVLEATSHGLDQHRVLGTNISIAVLTNITHEHLDYHKTYERYFQAKAKLLMLANTVILNKEDSSYRRLKKMLGATKKVIGYDRKAITTRLSQSIREKFPEPYNQLNAIAAIFAAEEVGVKESTIITSIKSFSGVRGRMEEITNNKEIRIFIDFAHTPEALKSVLKHLERTEGRNLVVVCGCAGERDVAKRAMMGAVSARFAGISVFTAEDPRTEDVKQIIQEMAEAAFDAGAKEFTKTDYRSVVSKRKKSMFIRIPERGEAISFAIQKLAKSGDTVVICGKGHEKSMSYDGIEYPWSDHKAISAALKGEVKKIKRR